MNYRALAISNAASDIALRLLRQEIRESGLAGLGQFNIGSLITTAIQAASQVATAKIAQQTQTNVAKQQLAMQQAADALALKQAELQAKMQEAASGVDAGSGITSSASSSGFMETLTKPTVWVPVAIAGGALVLFVMMRK